MTKQLVPFDGQAHDKAVLLLAAAERLDLDPSVVETRDGAFYVPEEVLAEAGLEEPADDDDAEPAEDEGERVAPEGDQAPADEPPSEEAVHSVNEDEPKKPRRSRAKRS